MSSTFARSSLRSARRSASVRTASNARPARVVLRPGPVELIRAGGRDPGPGSAGRRARGRPRAAASWARARPRRQQRGEGQRTHSARRAPVIRSPSASPASSAAFSRTASAPSASSGWAQAQRTGRRPPLVSISARRRTVPPASAARQRATRPAARGRRGDGRRRARPPRAAFRPRVSAKTRSVPGTPATPSLAKATTSSSCPCALALPDPRGPHAIAEALLQRGEGRRDGARW